MHEFQRKANLLIVFLNYGMFYPIYECIPLIHCIILIMIYVSIISSLE
jgi:hypothetical protein